MTDPTPSSPHLTTAFRVLLHRMGRGKHLRLVRRIFPFYNVSGTFNELQTAYLDNEHGLESLNAQKTVLADLRFFELWVSMKQLRDPNWVSPARRAARNQVPVTQREVRNFATWCQRNAGSLTKEVGAGSSNVIELLGDDVVGTQYRNRRLRNASKYLQWLTTMLATIDENDVEDISLVEVRRRLVDRWFDKQLLPDVKASPPRSLNAGQARAFQQVLEDKAQFPDTPIGIRDQLILRLLDQGLRAGELLKIKVTDVDDMYKIDIGRTIGVVSVKRRPNDIDDERLDEPAVKTRPGTLPIPRRLAADLIAYITGARRDAIDDRSDGGETQYLFVNHSGRYVGRALGQRNLNRLVAKLQGQFGLPATFVPHVLRHTHLTDRYDDMRKKGHTSQDIRDALIDRGRWAPNSTMPRRYIDRSLLRESAEFVEERDRKMRNG